MTQDKREPVEGNAKSEESVTDVCEEWEEDMEATDAPPKVMEEEVDRITQAEKTVIDNQPV